MNERSSDYPEGTLEHKILEMAEGSGNRKSTRADQEDALAWCDREIRRLKEELRVTEELRDSISRAMNTGSPS